VRVTAFRYQEEAKQLCETTIVVVALWAIAIAFNPFRMLREKRVVHLALQRDIRRSFNRPTGKTGRVHYLTPDVLPLRNGIKDSVPATARVKDRHVQHQHRVVPTPARAKPLSRFFLIFRMHCDHFLSLGCSTLEANSTNTSAQKIDIMIMAGPSLTGRARGYHRLRRRKDQSQFSNCESRKCFGSALLPFGDELPGTSVSELHWRSYRLRNHGTL
jgi:hypothetical protein